MKDGPLPVVVVLAFSEKPLGLRPPATSLTSCRCHPVAALFEISLKASLQTKRLKQLESMAI
jgi:hypothetical protein